MIYLFSNTPKEGVEHVKIIDIEFLRPQNIKPFDTIIFTSKNAIKALKYLKIPWKHCPCFVIGEPTAKEVLKEGGKVEFVSKSSYGDEFAKEIKPLLAGRKPMLFRAKEVVSDIKAILDIDETIVYETKCSKKSFKKPPKQSKIIFTSPSSVKCFLERYNLDKSYKIICIGKKTALSLPKDIDYFLPKILTIDECIELAKSL